MILTSLHLQCFGRFDDEAFTFKPGVNLVTGPNEAGKSTIIDALSGILFGFRKDRERYVKWGTTGRCRGEVVLQDEDRTLSICRDFLTDRVVCVETVGQTVQWRFEGKIAAAGRSAEREEYFRRIEELFGVADADIFRSSLLLRQGEVEVCGDGDFTARLKQLLTGSDGADYEAVMASLEKELHGITRKPGGRSKERELEEIQARMEALANLWKETAAARAASAKMEAGVATLRQEVETERREAERGRQYLDLARKHNGITERMASLREEHRRLTTERQKVEELHARRDKLLATLPPGLEEIPEELPAVMARSAEVHDALERLRREEDTLSREIAAAPHSGGIGYLAVAVAVLLLPVAAWLAHLQRYLVPAAVVAGVLAVLMLLLWRRAATASAVRRSRLEGGLDRLQTEAAALHCERADLDGRLAVVTDFYPDASSDELAAVLQEDRDAIADLQRLDAALAVLTPLETLLEQEAETTRELAVLDERVETMKQRGFQTLSPEELLEAEEKVRRLEEALREKETALLKSEHEASVARDAAEGMEAIEEEGEQLKRRETALKRRAAALKLALEVLAESVDQYRESYLDRFAREIGTHLETMTAGRYRDVQLDHDFNLSITAGEPRPVTAFSFGTREQAWLATRVALGNVLAKGRRVPFLLDDPLVNFDDERRTAALRGLNLLSRDHQVLLFVHDERYLKAKGTENWHKIRLEGKEAVHGKQLHLL